LYIELNRYRGGKPLKHLAKQSLKLFEAKSSSVFRWISLELKSSETANQI